MCSLTDLKLKQLLTTIFIRNSILLYNSLNSAQYFWLSARLSVVWRFSGTCNNNLQDNQKALVSRKSLKFLEWIQCVKQFLRQLKINIKTRHFYKNEVEIGKMEHHCEVLKLFICLPSLFSFLHLSKKVRAG